MVGVHKPNVSKERPNSEENEGHRDQQKLVVHCLEC